MANKVPVTKADRNIAASIESESGGSSTYLDTREPVSGRGFMVGQASEELQRGKPDPVYPRPANPADVAKFYAAAAPRHVGDPNAVQGAWGISDTGYVMDVSRRIKNPTEARAAGLAQMQEAAYALPNTRLGRGSARAGARGADVLLNLGEVKVPPSVPPTTSERPIPQVLHHFGVNDSDARWNPVHLDTPGHGFTRYEAENRSWSVAGGLVPTPEPETTPEGKPNPRAGEVLKEAGGALSRPMQPHKMGELLRGVNERRANMARNAYWHAHGLGQMPMTSTDQPKSE